MKFGFNGPSGFAAEDVWKYNLSDLGQRSNNDSAVSYPNHTVPGQAS